MKNLRGGLSHSLILLLLALVMASCGVPGIVSTNAQLPVVNATPQATPLPPVRFPQDEAAHRDLTEWWYYTRHMNATTPDGKPHHYGFELVFFQVLRSDLPPVFAAHFAITDVTRGQFHFDQRRQTEPGACIPPSFASSHPPCTIVTASYPSVLAASPTTIRGPVWPYQAHSSTTTSSY